MKDERLSLELQAGLRARRCGLQVAKIVHWLLSKKPSERPSAQELLRSSLIPPAVGDEQLTDLLRSLKDNRSTLDRVVDTIFSLPAPQTDPDEVSGAPSTGQVLLKACTTSFTDMISVSNALTLEST